MNGRNQVRRLQQRLENTLGRAPGPTTDIEVQADFAKYFCILVSGFIENAIIALILDFAQKRSSLEVALYIERQLNYWANPNCEKIIQLLGGFSQNWRDHAEKYLVDEKKDSVNSLVSLRNKIAHGESVGTSLSQIKGYFAVVLKVIQFIANLTDPPTAAV